MKSLIALSFLIIFGWLAFGDVPTANIQFGAAIIVCAGLVIWFRETHAARARRARPIS